MHKFSHENRLLLQSKTPFLPQIHILMGFFPKNYMAAQGY